MTQEEKMEVAVFRFGVIHDFVSGLELDYGEQKRLIKDKCARKWKIPYSNKTRISKSALLRWIKIYKDSNGKLESLCPSDRCDQGKSRAMDEETCLSLIRLRTEFPKITVPHLLKEMDQRGLITPGEGLNPSTVYRFLHQQGLMDKIHVPEDRRRFEAELPNDLWQSDVMHGPMVPVNDKMRKSYLISFIDDHSRLVPYGGFYLSEGLVCYLDALENALLTRGLPRKLYVDNGPAFRSKHLEHITASLGIALIHSRPYKPQGRGKVERFYKTVRSDFLSSFKGSTLEELNEAFDLWLNEVYHRRKHTSTGKSPFDRFTSHMECIRTAPKDLKDYFRKAAKRRVTKDRVITLDGRLYEAPVALIGKQVMLLYHEHDRDHVEIYWNQKSYGPASPVNLHVNCKVKRDRNNDTEIVPGASRYQGGKLWKGER